MSMLDPAKRTSRGAQLQEDLTGAAAPEAATLLDASWRDYVYAEVWARPGLDLRSRFLISMSTAACAGDAAATQGYVHGALTRGEITLSELREAALHIAVYAGWSYGGVLDKAVTRAAGELGLAPVHYAPIRAQSWDPKVRLEEGRDNFLHNMKFGGPPAQTAYFEAGILNFVFGEMWNRPGLDQRARRWLTLVGVGNSSSNTPIRSHVWSAMASGNASREEMYEFVLQYAIHSGWPRASVMQAAVLEQAPRAEKGLPFEV
jgi:4-carboxymuconolactone decarboxylase